MSNARRLALLAFVLAGTGCADPDLVPETTAPPLEGHTRDAPGGADGDDDVGDEDDPDEDPTARVVCDDEVADATDATIGDQLAAFAADDYETALGYASRGFRAGIDAADLEDLIEQGYPAAADAVEHRSRECVQDRAGNVEVRVEITAADGSHGDLLYQLVVEDGAWRIAGAIALDRDRVEV